MLYRLSAAWFAFRHPDATVKELSELVKLVYDWTAYKNTKWSLRAKAVLGL